MVEALWLNDIQCIHIMQIIITNNKYEYHNCYAKIMKENTITNNKYYV